MIKSAVKGDDEVSWVSFLLRLLMAMIFAVAAMNKFMGGLDKTVMSFQKMFQETWLPAAMVTGFARAVPYIEVILPAWLVSGYRLKWAWIATTLFMISLTFGVMVAGMTEVAANNAFYVFVCCAGLYFSQHDRMRFD